MPDSQWSDAKPPFDRKALDKLMAAANLDAILVSSRHNVRYLLGGYRFFFFAYMDAVGSSRYLPVVLYLRDRPDETAYFGNVMEKFEVENGSIWCPRITTSGWNSDEAIAGAIDQLRAAAGLIRRIGIERPFLPVESYDQLLTGLPGVTLAEAGPVLQELRACKSAQELNLMTRSADGVCDSMLATFGRLKVGMSKHDAVAILKEEQTRRGLEFEYCLITAGASLNRAPSDQQLQAGDIISLDSGANFRGYIGDICRMGILGEPDDELQDYLARIDSVQKAAREACRPGTTGRQIYQAAKQEIAAAALATPIEFVAHGMGLVSHEAPQLTSSGDVRYNADYEDKGIRPGMVLSIETTIRHPRRGFIKLEDAVYVTEDGYRAIGDGGRGWNRVPGAA